ncbi:MAG: septal ring lytic transglycosylase RlpA family protein [Ignavibacteria bacterium]|nr:septal ring lytic transglycosylase RlpA family protein [Ignavibacteria bacterium]
MIYSYLTRSRLVRFGIFTLVVISILSVRLILLAQDIPLPLIEPPAKTIVRLQPAESQFYQSGKASWYGGIFHKRKTASGVRFDMNGFTAAHRKLPFGSIVVITDLRSGKKGLVCINDRGPFIKSKILDLSRKAAQDLGGNLQKVSIEAFIPEKCTPLQSDSTLLLSFLADFTPILLDISTCTLIESFEDFTQAVTLQKELTSASPDIRYTLSIAFNPEYTGSGRRLAGRYIYHISALDTDVLTHEEISSIYIQRQDP